VKVVLAYIEEPPFGWTTSADVDAVNRQLRVHLGSAKHRQSMARFGLSEREIDPVLR
jgi:hypothetical protein